jgi:hypothetical protein
MTVSANTYAEHEDVERLIGDIVPNREFDVDTIPSLTQAESELDNAAADLNRELDQVGYTVPVSEADWPTAYAFLKAANAYGAAAVLLTTVPANSYDPDDEIEQTGETRATTYGNKFKSALKAIRENRIRAGRRVGRLSRIYAGSQADDNGNEKKPIFTRGMDSYPGSPSGAGEILAADEDDE